MENKKSKIPYIFFAFFAVIFLVNGIFIYVAKKSWRGVVEENSYQKGLQYNDTIKNFEKQQQLGWKVDFKHQRISEKSLRIFLKISDKNSRIINDAVVNLLFKRPTQDGYDFTSQAFYSSSQKLYLVEADFPFLGQWDVEIFVKKDGDEFKMKQRLDIE